MELVEEGSRQLSVEVGRAEWIQELITDFALASSAKKCKHAAPDWSVVVQLQNNCIFAIHSKVCKH